MNFPAPPAQVALCPICHEQTQIVPQNLYDDRYGYPDSFVRFRCASCGHQHIATHFTPDDVARLYTQYYPRGNFDLQSFQPEVEKRGFFSWLNGDKGSAFRWVPRQVRVLDIGCGLGTTLAYHRNRGCEAFGIEADANVQPVAARYGLNITQGVFDGTQFETASFDYVTLDQVAEHVVDPVALLRGVARVLQPGGKAIITTPNPGSFNAILYGSKWLNWHVPYHIQFYTRKSLEELAARDAGLVVEKHRTTANTAWQLFQWYHVLGFPDRGDRHPFWTNGQLPKDRRFARALLGLLKELDVHVWIARILDMVGLGDNHVFVLRKP